MFSVIPQNSAKIRRQSLELISASESKKAKALKRNEFILELLKTPARVDEAAIEEPAECNQGESIKSDDLKAEKSEDSDELLMKEMGELKIENSS